MIVFMSNRSIEFARPHAFRIVALDAGHQVGRRSGTKIAQSDALRDYQFPRRHFEAEIFKRH